jgi:hypothetical protein
MRGHGDVENPPPVTGQHDQHEQDPEGGRGDGEELQRDDLRQVMRQKGPPGGRDWASWAYAIFLDCGFHHGNPKRPQFPQDARGALPRIRRVEAGRLMQFGRKFKRDTDYELSGTTPPGVSNRRCSIHNRSIAYGYPPTPVVYAPSLPCCRLTDLSLLQLDRAGKEIIIATA